MKSTFKNTSWVVVAMLCLSSGASASTIVKWGESGGDDTIVTANANGSYGTTYTGTYVSPADGASGYSTNAAGQTRNYYGAMDPNGNPFGPNENGGAGGTDAIQMVKNFGGAGGTVESMIAWEAPDFMTSDRVLASFAIEFATRGGTTTARYLIETADGWYQSNQTLTDDDYTTINTAIGDLTWSSFSLFGVTGGGANPADPDNIISVGAYFTTTIGAGGTWSGAKLQYFQVTAAPALTWDGSPDTTWTGTSDATSWSGRTYDDGDAVQFLDTGAGTVSISGTVSPASILVDSSSDYSLGGGVIAGTADGLTKTNSGTLTLTGANTYTGDTSVDEGTLEIGGSGKVGDYHGELSIASGAVFKYSSDQVLGAANRFDGNISGDGSFVVDTSSGSVLFGGGTKSVAKVEVKAGRLEAQSSDSALGTAATTVHLGDTSGTADAELKISGATRTFTTKAGLTVEAGSSGTKTLISSSVAYTDSTPITLEDDLTIENEGPLTLGGVISDSGGSFGLTLNAQDATDTLTLSEQTKTVIYSGATTIDHGTLILSRGANPPGPQGTVTINNGGTLAFGHFNQLSKDGSIPDVVVNSGGVIDSSATVTTFDNLTLNGGTLESKGGLNTAWGSFVVLDAVTVTADSLIEDVSGSDNLITPGDFNGNRTLTFDIASGVTLTNELGIADYNSGAGNTYSIVKDSDGTLTQANAESNAYSGTLTVSDGTLREVTVGDGTAASLNNPDWTRPMSETTIADGARLIIDTTSYTDNRSRLDVGTITINSGATLELHHDSSNTGTDKYIWTGGSLLGSGTLVKSGGSPADIAWSGSAASLNSFNGAISVDEGSLAVNSGNTGTAGSGNSDVTVALGAEFDVRSGTVLIDSLDGAGTVKNSSGTGNTLSLGNNDGSGTFSGAITLVDPDGFSVIKSGSGTQTLANAEGNTYDGTTTINGGTLVEQPSLTGGTWTRATSSTTIESEGTLVLDTSAQSNAGSRQDVGTITINSGGFLELTNTASTVDRSIWSGGSILGSGTLVKSGSGHQDIAWSTSKTSLDSFSGAISIEGGYLIVNPNAGVVAGSGNFDVTVDATLDIRTGTFKIDALDGSGTVYESDTGNTSILWLGNNDGDGNFSGSIQNGVIVLKNGAGTQTLSGANTTTGYLTINAGVLALAAGGSLNTEGTVRIASGAKMDLASGIDQTVGSLYLNGVQQHTKGTYGAVGSGADNEDDTYFSGSGVLRMPAIGAIFKFK
ncbi:MAG: hypothetical protein HN341_17755 [Verrucomicrobia bacterium]|nr:hypothetical protein [Verrucomicrobiota bacterium]